MPVGGAEFSDRVAGDLERRRWRRSTSSSSPRRARPRSRLPDNLKMAPGPVDGGGTGIPASTSMPRGAGGSGWSTRTRDKVAARGNGVVFVRGLCPLVAVAGFLATTDVIWAPTRTRTTTGRRRTGGP
jgi:hypothetical protein